jgi:hypothetical protein
MHLRADRTGQVQAREWEFDLGYLHVRSFEAGIALPEDGCLARVVAGRKWLRELPHAAGDHEVVLEVLSNARQMLHHRYAQGSQFIPIADPRLHQELWRVDGAERQHNFL